MTPTPPSTSASSSGMSPDNQYKVVRKRNRVPLSCAACRHRKLKCDRSAPCGNCVRRGDGAGCSYAAPGTRKKSQNQAAAAATTPDDMQNRIDRLEGLVLSLMTNGAQAEGPTAAHAAISRSTSASGPSSVPTLEDYENEDMIREEGDDSDMESVANSFGVLKVDAEAGKSMYLGDSHWHTVLSDIAEVKNYFNNHKRELDAQYSKVAAINTTSSKPGQPLLFSLNVQATEGELRAALPPKGVLEKLVSRFFNSLDPAVYILHYPTFHKALQEFILDSNSKSIVWIGLLYSVLTLAMQSYNKLGDEPPEWKGRTIELANEYRMRTVQSLILSDYTKSTVYTVETLILYMQGEYTSRYDVDVGVWMILGMTIRLAMRMGYHRDPKYFPGITPYQSEMRRRIWSWLRENDIMISSQLTLPNMVKPNDHDSQLPRNIFEDEFTTETKELPPARPDSEPTPVSYMIAKAKFAYIFGEVSEELNCLTGSNMPYETVMAKDQKLRDLQSSMAPHLRIRRLEDCMLDPASLLMQRSYLDILYQKTLCFLHRKYIARAHRNPRYAHSRRTCVESALHILEHQAVLHRETQPGGRLRTMKPMLASLSKNDFLLAAMVVCLDLNYSSSIEQIDPFFWCQAQQDNMIKALQASYVIWEETKDSSMEAYKAANILKIVLDKMKLSADSQRSAGPQTTAEAFAAFDEDLKPEHSAAMTLGMLSSGGMTPNTQMQNNYMSNLTGRPGVLKYSGVDMSMDDYGSTGLTPNYMMDSNSFGNLNGAASPFNMFGNMGLSNGMEMPANLDWNAWDSYVQNGDATFDPSMQFFAGGMDNSMPIPDPDADAKGENTGGVFMGANGFGTQ